MERKKKKKKRENKEYPQTSLATIRAVVVLQGTDDLIASVGQRKGAGKRGPGHEED